MQVNSSSIVVSFGTSVGVETAYWGKSSNMDALSFYRNLGGLHVPQTEEELLKLLDNPLEPLSKLGPEM